MPAARDRLLTAALEAFNAQGVAKASIHAICARAQVSIGSAYHHFGNKQGLADAVFAAGLQANLDALQQRLAGGGSAKQRVKALVASLIDWIEANPDWARYIYRADDNVAAADAVTAVNAQYAALLQDHFGPLLHAGELRQLPDALYASLVLGPVHDYARRWLAGQVAEPPSTHVKVFKAAAWRAVRPPQ